MLEQKFWCVWLFVIKSRILNKFLTTLVATKIVGSSLPNIIRCIFCDCNLMARHGTKRFVTFLQWWMLISEETSSKTRRNCRLRKSNQTNKWKNNEKNDVSLHLWWFGTNQKFNSKNVSYHLMNKPHTEQQQNYIQYGNDHTIFCCLVLIEGKTRTDPLIFFETAYRAWKDSKMCIGTKIYYFSCTNDFWKTTQTDSLS